jgi:hypothetical protein
MGSLLLAWELIWMHLSGPGQAYFPQRLSHLLVIIVLPGLQIMDIDKKPVKVD